MSAVFYPISFTLSPPFTLYLYEIFTSKDRSICTRAFAISFAHYWWSLKNFVSPSSFFLYILNQAYTGNNMEGGGNNISERLLGVIARSRFNLINALLSSDSHPTMPRQYLWLLVVFLLPSYIFIRNVSALPNWGRHWRRSAPVATTSLSLISSIGGWLFEWLVSKSPVTAKPSICWIERMILVRWWWLYSRIIVLI